MQNLNRENRLFCNIAMTSGYLRMRHGLSMLRPQKQDDHFEGEEYEN